MKSLHTTQWKVQINNVSLLTKYLSSESTTACTFMAWKPFLHTKLDSSSLAIPCIGIRVQSMAPATLGKFAMLWNPSLTCLNSSLVEGNTLLFMFMQTALQTSLIILDFRWNRYAMNIANPFCQNSQCCQNLQQVHI